MKVLNSVIAKLIVIAGITLFISVNIFSQKEATGEKACKPNVSEIIKTLRVENGLSLGVLYASCFPMPEGKPPGKIYDAYDEQKLKTVLKDSSGKNLNTFVWYGEKYLGKVKMTRYEIVGGKENLKELSAGNYTLDFLVDDKIYYTFPFTVKIRQSTDPYRSPHKIYLTDGEWRTNGTLDLIESTGYFKLNSWYRDFDKTAEKKPRSVSFEARIIRNRDKKIMAVASTSGLRLDNNWAAIPISFEKPRSDQNPKAYKETVSDILSADGKYTIETKLDGKPYINYEFEVKNRKINDVELNPRRTFIFIKGKSL